MELFNLRDWKFVFIGTRKFCAIKKVNKLITVNDDFFRLFAVLKAFLSALKAAQRGKKMSFRKF